MNALAFVGEGLFEIGLDGETLGAGYGGDAPNAAVMAALAGADARLGGRVGDDAFGRMLLAFWQERGVDTRFVRVDETAPTGIYVNETTEAGHRFDYHRTGSAGSRLAPEDVSEELLADVATVHLTGITLTVSPAAARAALDRAPRVSFAVNHRPRLAPDPAALLAAARAAQIVFVSDEEGEALLGEREPERIAAALGGEAEELVVTSGARGAAVLAGGAWSEVEAPPVEVVDAAGAGDALAGCYLAERVRGSEPAAALRTAVAAASLSCRSRGCAASYPNRTELDDFLRGLG